MSPRQYTKEEREANKEDVLRKGGFPDFVQIKEAFEVYKVFTEVNVENRRLVQGLLELQKEEENLPAYRSSSPRHDASQSPSRRQKNRVASPKKVLQELATNNIKDDLVLI